MRVIAGLQRLQFEPKVLALWSRDANGRDGEATAELPDGTPYEGHGSGITTSENFAFLTCDEGYLVFDVAALAQGGEAVRVRAIDKVDLEITPAFINIETMRSIPERSTSEPNYDAPEEHHLTTPDGSENAGVLFASYPALYVSALRLRAVTCLCLFAA